MENRLHEELVNDTEKLRRLVGCSSTESIVGMCAAYCLGRTKSLESPTELVSPGKQPWFLLGLMLTTPEPENPKEFGYDVWEESIKLLNSIFAKYMQMFWPKSGELPNLTEEWWKVREVAMLAFLHYFNSGLLATAEQVQARIRRYLVPFDKQLKSELGISTSEALRIAIWIHHLLQSSIDHLRKLAEEEKRARVALMDRAKVESWDLGRIRQEARSRDYLPFFFLSHPLGEDQR